jgi:hypothetical protein
LTYERVGKTTISGWIHKTYFPIAKVFRPKNLVLFDVIERKRPGLPLKRLLDGYNREDETDHLLA